MPNLARSLIFFNKILFFKDKTKFKNKLKSGQFFLLFYSYLPRIFEKIYSFCSLRYFKNFISIIIFFNYLINSKALAQDTNQIESDPFLDPVGVEAIIHSDTRIESKRAFMFGIGYGLNPIIVLAPSLNLGIYLDPIILGLEKSDSEPLGIWIKERKENFGNSRFSGESLFLKWFFEESFYLVTTMEKRRVNLWNRSYNRVGGKALFDMHFNTTLSSLGIGFLRFNDIGYLGIDILRLNIFKKESVEIVEHWETWSELSGTRDALDENIEERSEKWKDIIDSPTGFFITFGFYF